MTDKTEPAAPQPAFFVDEAGARIRVLAKPIVGGATGEITQVKLRPPTYREIMTLGDPAGLLYVQDGALPQEDIATIARYADTLAIDQNGEKILPALLNQLGYLDALAVKDAVLDFFKTARGSITSEGASAR